MRITAVGLVIFIMAGEAMAQTSLFGGANVNIYDDKPLTSIRYFGGIEFKVGLSENLKLYMSPQYMGLTEGDHRMESVVMPLGISFQFNEMWDERTNLFRFIDINAGPYGGYIFEVKDNQEYVTEGYNAIDYGAQVSAKFRLFIFYPLYISYSHSLAYLIEDNKNMTFEYSTLQFGVYFPISTILRDY